MANRKYVLLITIFFAMICSLSQAEVSQKQNIMTLRPERATTAPKIDGVLDEEIWAKGPILDDVFITYNPMYGDPLPFKTKVYMAYDPDNLYFAFYCYDDEPDKIKTSITKHDNMWSDDWVGLSIDTAGNKQFAYEFFLNPSGIQGDIYNSSSTGEDSSPDYVWYSAGQVVKDGYIVEIQVPLKSFRFKSGENVEMNIIFWRRINRLGISGSWPEILPNQSLLQATSKVIYGQLNDQSILEFLPSVTYSSKWDRLTPEKWSSADDIVDFGIGVKYGITSSITADLTYNPDFSQVESDSFQVLVNQRYPIFYSEKRPFFMEAGNLFSLAGSWAGDPNLWSVFHTRTVVDPLWGVKFSGDAGNLSFGLLGASDESPGRKFEDEDNPNPYEGKEALFLGARAKYDLGNGNYVGCIYTSRDFADGYNRAIGADFTFRLEDFSFRGNYLFSFTKDSETTERTNGSEWTVMGSYSTKPLDLELWWEHMDTDFRMDTAFYQRTGMDKFTAYIGPNLYPEGENWSWIKRINPFFWGYYVHDHRTGEDDYIYLLAVRFSFIKDGWLRFDYRKFSEYWAIKQLSGSQFYMNGYAQWTNWFYTNVGFAIGDKNYYDPVDPFVGDVLYFYFLTSIQPDDKFTQRVSYEYWRLDSKIDGSKVYDVSIICSRTVYQFNKYLFFRALIQYDSYREIVLSDLLLSYQLNPQTVLHLGYGSLHENLGWNDNQWLTSDTNREYYQTVQSVFFKVSYLFQL